MRKRNCNVMYKIKQKHGEKRKGEREIEIILEATKHR